MNTIELHTFEDIHHVCLMYGLKNAFCRFPFLADNVMTTPPPIRRNPERPGLPVFIKKRLVNVLYYKNEVRVIFDESRVNDGEIKTFAMAIINEYLALRHPYMKAAWDNGQLHEAASGHLLAKIVTVSPMTDGRP